MVGYLLVAYDSTTQCLVHLQCFEILWNYESNSRKYRKKNTSPGAALRMAKLGL